MDKEVSKDTIKSVIDNLEEVIKKIDQYRHNDIVGGFKEHLSYKAIGDVLRTSEIEALVEAAKLMHEIMPDLDNLISMRNKATSGEWITPHICDGDVKCNCTTICDHTYTGGLFKVLVNNGIDSVSDGGNDCPPLDEAKANAAFVVEAANIVSKLAEKMK